MQQYTLLSFSVNISWNSVQRLCCLTHCPESFLTVSWHRGKPCLAALCDCMWGWGESHVFYFLSCDSSKILLVIWVVWPSNGQGRQDLTAVSGLVLQCHFPMIIRQKSFLLTQWYRLLFSSLCCYFQKFTSMLRKLMLLLNSLFLIKHSSDIVIGAGKAIWVRKGN